MMRRREAALQSALYQGTALAVPQAHAPSTRASAPGLLAGPPLQPEPQRPRAARPCILPVILNRVFDGEESACLNARSRCFAPLSMTAGYNAPQGGHAPRAPRTPPRRAARNPPCGKMSHSPFVKPSFLPAPARQAPQSPALIKYRLTCLHRLIPACYAVLENAANLAPSSRFALPLPVAASF